MRKYKVRFAVSGNTSTIVEAEDEDQAEELARKRLEDGFELYDGEIDDGELEECWDVEDRQSRKPLVIFRRKLANDGRSHFRLSVPAVLAEFLGVAPEGGMIEIAVDTENGRLIITKAKE